MSNFLNITLGTKNVNKVFLGSTLIWVRDNGQYKSIDIDVVYNKGVPEGETCPRGENV